MMKSSYHMCETVCVCDSVCVLCIWQSISPCISASGHPFVVREVSLSLWDLKGLLTPKAVNYISRMIHFYLCVKKANRFIFFQVAIGPQHKLIMSASQSNCPIKDVKGIETGSMTSSTELALTFPVLQAAQPPFDEGPLLRSPKTHKTAVDGLLQHCWTQAWTEFAQCLLWILGYRYLCFLEPSFLYSFQFAKVDIYCKENRLS